MPNYLFFNRILNQFSRKHFSASLVCFLVFLTLSVGATGDGSDSLNRLLVSCKPNDKARLLNDLAGKTMDEKPEQAILYATEALNMARKHQIYAEEARALFMLAESAVTMGNHEEAISYYQQSADIEKRISGERSENYATRIGDIGYCYYIMEQPLKAMPYLQESLQLSVRGGHDVQAASMYSNIGAIHTEWGDYSKGLVNNQLALVIDRISGKSEQISTDLNNIGKIYEKWGKYNLAVKYYLESLDIARKADNKSMIAIRLNNLGIVHRAWKKYPEALGYFNEALTIDRSAGNIDKVGKRLANIGATYLVMGNFNQCLSFS
jgi:tetratricopeptide (TPR) repeat protein